MTKRIAIGDVTFEMADHGRGRPLLLVHGFPLDHTMWRGQWETLSADFRVLAPDLRGFGGSGGAAEVVTMDRFADDLALLLDALGVREPVAVGGLSMGGYIAWEFWRRHRARVRALILCDTRAAADPPEAAQNRWRTAERALAEGVGFLADTMLSRLFAPRNLERQPRLVEETRQKLLAAPPQAVAAASRGMAQRPDSRALLETIAVPTLVLCGVEDGISPVAEMRGMAGRIRGARFVEIPDAGHMSPVENPQAVNAAIREFLLASGPGSPPETTSPQGGPSRPARDGREGPAGIGHPCMNHVERFRAVMNFQPVDRLPMWEWAMWWDETIARWRTEGLPAELHSVFDIAQYLGLDPYQQFWFSTTAATIEAVQHHVEGVVGDMDDYLRILPRLYPDHRRAIAGMAPWAERQRTGAAVVWITLEGPFWFTRTLMGFERLMYAYYDQPELIDRIRDDLLRFNVGLLEQIRPVCVPTFMTIAEDMSYNHGPMISRAIFERFVAPFYRRLLERVKELGILTIVDTDGDVTLLAPWLLDVGVDGVLPLERQAGVDGLELRRRFPQLRLVGHYNKLVMNQGEMAIRGEFERLVPLMRTGGFIPSVDHQTPPGVSLEQYRTYLRVLSEYVPA